MRKSSVAELPRKTRLSGDALRRRDRRLSDRYISSRRRNTTTGERERERGTFASSLYLEIDRWTRGRLRREAGARILWI